jgi:hypothetical protein
MNHRRGKYFSLFLIGIFLFPSVVKLEHHHELVNYSHSEKSSQAYHNDCPICDFHFSLFIEQNLGIEVALPSYFDQYENLYKTPHIVFLAYILFLYRAPPFS